MRPIEFDNVALKHVVRGKTVAEQSVSRYVDPRLFDVLTHLVVGGIFEDHEADRRYVVLAMVADRGAATLIVEIDAREFTTGYGPIGDKPPGTIVETMGTHGERLQVIGTIDTHSAVQCRNLGTGKEEPVASNWLVYEVLTYPA